MFAGKTTALLHRCRSHLEQGQSVILLKHSSDSRYDDVQGIRAPSKGNPETRPIITHDGDRMDAWTFTTIAEAMPAIIAHQHTHGTGMVAIDEGHFFDDIASGADKLANLGHHVVIAGLLQSYHRLPFENMSALVPLCETIETFFARCITCHGAASFTRHLEEHLIKPGMQLPPVLAIGGAEKYGAYCRECYWSVIATHTQASQPVMPTMAEFISVWPELANEAPDYHSANEEPFLVFPTISAADIQSLDSVSSPESTPDSTTY